MKTVTTSDAAKAVVRPNSEEVQGKGNFDVFEELLRTILSITPRNFAITPTKPPAMAVRNVFERTDKKRRTCGRTRVPEGECADARRAETYVEAQPK